MSNVCNNKITIIFGSKEKLQNFINNHPHCNQIIQQGHLGILFLLSTIYEPDFLWLESLIHTYHCWIKNEWRETNGNAGIWIGFMEKDEKNIKKMEWNDLSIEAESFFFTKKDE